MPETYSSWNRRHGAPFGYLSKRITKRLPGQLRRARLAMGLSGPFAFQPNNTTRRFEYPWAYHAAELSQSMKALDIGGGLSGFPFVLSREGIEVTNVDPGEEAAGRGWPVSAEMIRRMNRAFRTDVRLVPSTLQDARLSAGMYDRVFSISTIEHIPADEIPELMREVHRLLKPSGLFVATVDLFLNLAPFTDRLENEYGTNTDIRALAEAAPFELAQGRTHELYGYPDFSANCVLRQLEQYMLGQGYPALVQCLVLKKRAEHGDMDDTCSGAVSLST